MLSELLHSSKTFIVAFGSSIITAFCQMLNRRVFITYFMNRMHVQLKQSYSRRASKSRSECISHLYTGYKFILRIA